MITVYKSTYSVLCSAKTVSYSKKSIVFAKVLCYITASLQWGTIVRLYDLMPMRHFRIRKAAYRRGGMFKSYSHCNKHYRFSKYYKVNTSLNSYNQQQSSSSPITPQL